MRRIYCRYRPCVTMFIFLLLLVGVSWVQGGTTPDTRIVNGEEAPEGAFPWMASLRYMSYNQWLHFCGGSVMNKHWILTAAHCTDGIKADQFKVWLGTNTLNAKDGDVYEVEKIVNHENYSRQKLINDVSVVKLKEEIKFGDKVKPIALNRDYIRGNDICIVSGFGYINTRRTYPERLQMLKLIILDEKKCKERFTSSRFTYHEEQSICSYANNNGTCQGDSGGPVIKDEKQVGIVSYGTGCGTPYHVYMRVSYHADWITEHVK